MYSPQKRRNSVSYLHKSSPPKDTEEQQRVFKQLMEECSQILSEGTKDYKCFYTIDGRMIKSFNELVAAFNFSPL